MEREARHTLFDDLQRGWSDTTFAAERLRLEALDEDGAQTQHEPEVIGVEDRAREGLAEADLSERRVLECCRRRTRESPCALASCPSECSVWFLCPSRFGSARVSCPWLRF